ncbi:hypothetical protein NVP1024O_78 [Vibrio phage 1.024.O._10N.261.45.F8]|nr:hypothetical protein NVP1024O_78 [Vibrio phage 1.024.O._10N.261.45.F8]
MKRPIIDMTDFAEKHLEFHPEGRVFNADVCDLLMAKNNIEASQERYVQNSISLFLQNKGYEKKVISIQGLKRQGFVGVRLRGLDRTSAIGHPQTRDIDSFLSDRVEYDPSFSVPVFQFMSEYAKTATTTEGKLTLPRELNRRLRLRNVRRGKAEHFNNTWESFIGVRLK